MYLTCFKMKWNDLTMSQRSDLMKLYLKHDITSLDSMREHYNNFTTNGRIKQTSVNGCSCGK